MHIRSRVLPWFCWCAAWKLACKDTLLLPLPLLLLQLIKLLRLALLLLLPAHYNTVKLQSNSGQPLVKLTT
jgi:hypothetical protein